MNISWFSKILVTTILFSKVIITYGQQATEQNTPAILYQEARRLIRETRYDSAIGRLKLSETLYRKEKDWKGLVSSMALLGELYRGLRYNEKALKKFQETLAIHKQYLPGESIELAELFQFMGKYYDFNIHQFDHALEYYNSSLEIRKKLLGEDSAPVANLYYYIGSIYMDQAKHDQALTLLKKTIRIYGEVNGPNHVSTYPALNSIATVYRNKYDFENALLYCKQAEKVWLASDRPRVHDDLAKVYVTMGILNMNMGKMNESVTSFTKALTVFAKVFGDTSEIVADTYISLGEVYQLKSDYEQSNLYYAKAENILKLLGENDDHYFVFARLYYSWANCGSDMGEFDKALDYYDKALMIYKKNLPPDDPEVIDVYFNQGLVYVKKQQLDKALALTLRALSARTKVLGNNNPQLAGDYASISSIYIQDKQFSKAMEFAERALELYGPTKLASAKIIPHLNKAKIFIHGKKYADARNEIANAWTLGNFKCSPDSLATISDYSFDKLMAIQILSVRSELWVAMHENHIDNMLTNSLTDLKNIILLYQAIMRETYFKESKTIQMADFFSVCQQGVIRATELYQQTNNEKFKVEAYEIAEQGKSLLLLQNLNETKAKKFAGIPDSLLNEEKAFKDQIVFLENELNHSRIHMGNDPAFDSLLVRQQNSYVEVRQHYSNFVANLEKNFPAYYNLKYEQKILPIEHIQDISRQKNQAFLEYIFDEKQITAFLFMPSEFKLFTFHNDSLLSETIRNFRADIISKNSQSFTKASHLLYQRLFKPVDNMLSKTGISNIIIMPDQYLSLIPFETLLPDPNQKGYLINKYTIGYHYSIKLASGTLVNQDQSLQHKVIGFAPDFSNISTQVTLAYDDITRDNFQILEGTQKELNSIKKLFDGDFYASTSATEDIFKANAERYQVIHLATHAIIDDVNPELSKLIFSKSPNSVEDGFLYGYELYNLQLHADLLTLSACNTGFGKLQKGEGMMSLARGFAYAGCPNVVMSLWPASDQSTALLMEYFYEGIRNGLPKDEALRQAKIKYLDEAGPLSSDPYYWANFIFVGDPAPVLPDRTALKPWIIILGGLLLVFFASFLIMRRSRRSRTLV